MIAGRDCLLIVIQNPNPSYGSCCLTDPRRSQSRCLELRNDRAGNNVEACRRAGGFWTPNGKCQEDGTCPCASANTASSCAPNGGLGCANLPHSPDSERYCISQKGQYNPGRPCDLVNKRLICPATGTLSNHSFSQLFDY